MVFSVTKLSVSSLPKFKALILSLLLGFSLIGCGGDDTTGGGGGGELVIAKNAQVPIITAHPLGATYIIGTSASELNVTANVSDNGTLSYQWYQNAVNSNTGSVAIPGANSSSYKPSTQNEGIFSYYVVVTNTNTEVNGLQIAYTASSLAVVNVISATSAQAPIIATQPQSKSYTKGESASGLSVSAIVTDGGKLSYQWYQVATNSNSGGIPVGTDSSSYVPSTQTEGTFYYYVVVTNTNNGASGTKTVSTASIPATITITAAPVVPSSDIDTPIIAIQPQSSNSPILRNSTVTLSVGASVTDGGTLSYQWYKNGVAIAGANLPFLVPSTADEGVSLYHVIVTNTNNGKTKSTPSVPVLITVKAEPVDVVTSAQAPHITEQPRNTSYFKNRNAETVLSVNASGSGNLSYQWYQNNAAIAGATSYSYTPSTSTNGTFYYYVVVTNTENGKTASVASNVVTVVVESVYHSVSFFDSNIDLIKTVKVEEGEFIPYGTLQESWYLANGTSPVATINVAGDVNLYNVTGVQEVANQAGLDKIRGNLKGTYVLTKDIDLTLDPVRGWEPIGNSNASGHFTGIFNGNNHAIKGLWIKKPSDDYVGFFSVIENAQIKNLSIEIDGKVEGSLNVGGIAGKAINSDIINSSSKGDVGGNRIVGGIVGYFGATSNIINSYSSGNIDGLNTVGGIAGTVSESSNIANSYSAGNIRGTDVVGGLAGVVEIGINGATSSSITNSYSTGNVNGYGIKVGGIAGEIVKSSVTNSYASGNIIGSKDDVGGIVGYIGDTDSIVAGNAAINPSIKGTGNTTHRIVGNPAKGAPLGLKNNLALKDTLVNGKTHSGIVTVLDGISKDSNQLRSQSTYENATWKFGYSDDSPWKINEGNGLPYLYWQN